jgi:hypothetical protein
VSQLLKKVELLHQLQIHQLNLNLMMILLDIQNAEKKNLALMFL